MFILKLGNKTHPITKDITRIGRHTSNDIVLAETRVSRFHVEIVVINERIFLIDKKTVNGTFIGDKRILPDREILLKTDDNIGIGSAAGELGACTIKVEYSSDETPPNEDNEVVSTTNDSDSDQNLLNGPDDDEYPDGGRLCEELPERPCTTEFPVAPQKDANELEKEPAPPSAVTKPAESGPSSRQPETTSLPQVKSEPGICSPDNSTNAPHSSSSQTTNPRVKPAPTDEANASVPQPLVAINSAASSPNPMADLKSVVTSVVHEVLAAQLSRPSIIPGLLNLLQQNVVSSPESSTSQTSNISTDVHEESSAKKSHPSSLAANADERRRKTVSKKSTVTSDVPASTSVKMECINVDLIEEPENDVMEVTDLPPVTNETVDRLLRRTSSNDVNESRRQSSPEPMVENSRKSADRSNEAIINLCDANDDVIEISDEEGANQPRRRTKRKTVDPNTIVIEDTRDDAEVSTNLDPCSDKAVSAQTAKPSNKPKVDFAEKSTRVPKTELTNPVQPPPSNQPKTEQTNVSACVEYSRNKSKIELQQPIILDPVEDTPCDEQLMRTPTEPPSSDWQTFQQPVNTPSIDNSGFPQSKVEPIRSNVAETPLGKRENVTFEDEIHSESLLADAPSSSSFIELSEDRQLPAHVKQEPMTYEAMAPMTQSNYSNLDEIIALDSDDEDFPLSQLNTTQIQDVPDFSASFERMFEESEFIKDEPQMQYENTWFEPFSQTEMVEGKHVARIPMFTSDVDEAMTDKELQSILAEEPDGMEADEADEQMEVEDPSPSKPATDVFEFDENEQLPSSKWRSVEKRKYPLKKVSIRLTDAQPLSKKRSRKSQEEERRSSSSFDEGLQGLNQEPVKDATTKRRHTQPSPHKVRKRKRRSRSPTMTVQEKKLIKEKRKEKLKEITPKTNETETKWKDAFRPDAKPVVKVTDKNRASFLIDTIMKQSSLPKRPPKNELSSKEQSLPKADKPKSKPSTSKSHSKEAQRLPVLKEKVTHSNDSKSNDAKLVDTIIDRYCKDDAKPGPSRRGSIHEPEENAFANALIGIPYEAKKDSDSRKNDSEVAKKSANSSRRESHSHQKNKAGASSQTKMPKKSSLKKAPVIYGHPNIFEQPKPKKRVHFHRDVERKVIEWDATERRNNGIFAPAYKLNEHLIREGITEFETAMAKVCSWNVKWLEEQQKCFEPPPLYPESGKLSPTSTLTVKYKEELKLIMFNNLWQAIFRSWNKPDNDFLPHTQFINEKTSLSTLTIESVDTSKEEKKMWTIIAARTVPAHDTENDLSNGQVVILNFPILTSASSGEVPSVARKTMVFSYVAGITKTYSQDKDFIHQRMILRVSSKPFQIVLGEAKLKVLSYLKPSLRPFQALAMIPRSPLTDLITDPSRKFFFDPVFDASGDWFGDKFLDSSQRRAVASCLNCILSSEPSICLVDGAPGTGKSQVIVSLMRELFSKNNRNRFPSDLRVLIVTAQEVVADDLSYRLESLNKKDKLFNFLRYGNYRNKHATVRNCTLEKKIQDLLSEDQGNQLINLDEEVSENSKVIEQLKSQMAKEMTIESADCILTSVSSCWTSNFEHDFVPTHFNKGDVHKFTVCIFDDASLINETAMLVPMMLMVRSLILVGDHRNQINISKSRSPFFRLLNDCAKKAPSAVTELHYQYRSPPLITQWVDEFYDIKCKPKNMFPPGFKWKIKSFFVLDLPLPALDHINDRYETQANYCSMLVEKLNVLVEDPKVRFGVIVAQSSQKDIIKGSIGFFEQGRRIIVETLDEFSGREQDVVILCLPYQGIQYASWLYLAVTRASRSLFVCGDFGQLRDQDCVTSMVKFARSRNLYSPRVPFETDIPNSLILSSS